MDWLWFSTDYCYFFPLVLIALLWAWPVLQLHSAPLTRTPGFNGSTRPEQETEPEESLLFISFFTLPFSPLSPHPLPSLPFLHQTTLGACLWQKEAL